MDRGDEDVAFHGIARTLERDGVSSLAFLFAFVSDRANGATSCPRALTTFKELAELISRRWVSNHTNARLEGLNSLFQAAKSRA